MADLSIPLLAFILFASFATAVLHGAIGIAGGVIMAITSWIFKRYDYSVPAAVIGILLGGMAEDSIVYTYQISGGQWSYLLERPVTIIILGLLVMSLFGSKLVSILTGKIRN